MEHFTKFYFTGDTHRNIISRLNMDSFPFQSDLTKKNYVIILGDFGGIWAGDKTDEYILNWLDTRNFTTLFVDGNHESIFKNTEVLTEAGFKRIEDIYNENIKIANYNIQTKEIKFDYPLSKHHKHHKEAISIKGFNTEQLVSLNHDIIVDNKKIKAHKLIDKDIAEKQFDLTGIANNKGIGLDKDILKILIWIVMDGTIIDYSKYNKNSKKCTIQFKLSKERKIKVLTELLGKAKIPFTVKPCKKYGINKLQPYYIRIYSDHARKLYKLLEYKKEIPFSWRNANKQEAMFIFQALSKSDGRLLEDTRIEWITTNKNDLNIIQEICIRNGFYFKFNEYENSSGFTKCCKKQYKSTLYIKKTLNTKVKIKKVDYNDIMYCYTMPLGTLITRLNGKIAFTGNCFDLLYTYPTEIWNGGKIHRIRDSVIHLDRGQVFNIDRTKFFTFGGAISIDQAYRTEHISWWKEEVPNKEEMDNGLDNLEKHNWTVDYILTHDCAKSIFYELKKFKTMSYFHDPLKEYLEEIKNRVNYKHWYCGHYHINQELDEKHTVLYDYILGDDW